MPGKDFTQRTISRSTNLGVECKAVRESKQLSLKEVSNALGIKTSYLKAIEEGNYDYLPARIYAINFIKAYAVLLGLDPKKLVKRYEAETEVKSSFLETHDAAPKNQGNPRMVITPERIRMAVLVVTGLIVLGYVAIQLLGILTPPEISFIYPTRIPIETEEGHILIQGEAKRAVSLTVNGSVIYLDDDGYFEEKVFLQEGANEFEFRAVSRFRKETLTSLRVFRVSLQEENDKEPKSTN